MVEQSNQFLTVDTSLAAYLVTEGFNLVEIRYEPRTNGHSQGTYVFASSLKLQNNVNLFRRGEADVNVVLYEHAKSGLLDRIKRGLP